MSVLAGKRIVITRASDKAQAFADQLRALGADPLVMPTIEIAPVENPAALDAALTRISDFDWLAFTSAHAIEQVWTRLNNLQIMSELPPAAVIGPATAKTLQQYDVEPALIAERHVAEGLFETLSAQHDLNGLKILLPQGDIARPILAQLLRQAGAEVTEVVAYRNIKPPLNIDSINQPIHAITFTSASTVENFCSLFDDPLSVIGSAFVVCIGPVTADAARDLGLPVHEIAEPHTIEGLLNALTTVFERNTVQ